jgi:dTDP-4-dehydrorhamnose reductase
MSLRILLTGKNGQLGSELCRLLPGLGHLVALDRAALDLAKPEAIRRAVRDVHPHLIINAAAYTKVDQAEKDEAAAFAANAEAPALFAEEGKKIGAALIHYSTDYIFDGSKSTPYLEDDPPNPLNVYGKSKLAGEQAIRASGVPHLILRTAWVYAPSGHNFLLTILWLSTQREELRIVCDQRGAPTWSRELAAATVRILTPFAAQGWKPDLLAAVSGTYHVTAVGETSWHQFAEVILEERSHAPRDTPWIAAATGNLPQITRRVTPISTAEYPTPARRPAYSVLSNSRLLQTFGFQLPGWRDQLHSVFHTA